MKNILNKFSLAFILVLCLSFNCICSVSNAKEPEEVSKENNIIYLTFDDGPSVMTNKVLDVLMKNDVKATFFIIGNQIEDQENVLVRIKNEGHSMGLHTYTHDFKKIYSSNKAFINEMKLTQEYIKKVTGISPNIIRFPGGSRNHLDTKTLNLLHSYNFKIYDWNVDSQDGINPKTSPSKLFRKATKSDVNSEPIILLMHCDYMHENTYKALDKIIKFYKDSGYEFRVIDENTPEHYFPLKKNK